MAESFVHTVRGLAKMYLSDHMITQRALAQDIDYSDAMVSLWLRGKSDSPHVAQRIHDWLAKRISLDSLKNMTPVIEIQKAQTTAIALSAYENQADDLLQKSLKELTLDKDPKPIESILDLVTKGFIDIDKKIRDLERQKKMAEIVKALPAAPFEVLFGSFRSPSRLSNPPAYASEGRPFHYKRSQVKLKEPCLIMFYLEDSILESMNEDAKALFDSVVSKLESEFQMPVVLDDWDRHSEFPTELESQIFDELALWALSEHDATLTHLLLARPSINGFAPLINRSSSVRSLTGFVIFVEHVGISHEDEEDLLPQDLRIENIHLIFHEAKVDFYLSQGDRIHFPEDSNGSFWTLGGRLPTRPWVGVTAAHSFLRNLDTNLTRLGMIDIVDVSSEKVIGKGAVLDSLPNVNLDCGVHLSTDFTVDAHFWTFQGDFELKEESHTIDGHKWHDLPESWHSNIMSLIKKTNESFQISKNGATTGWTVGQASFSNAVKIFVKKTSSLWSGSREGHLLNNQLLLAVINTPTKKGNPLFLQRGDSGSLVRDDANHVIGSIVSEISDSGMKRVGKGPSRHLLILTPAPAILKLSNLTLPILQFGSTGSGDGQFLGAASVACNKRGDIIVSDSRNHCIQFFDKTGAFLKKIASFGKNDDKFKSPMGVSVHPKNNQVFVCDSGNGQIQVFDENGQFVTSIGRYGKSDGCFMSPHCVAFCPDAGFIVVDKTDRVQRFAPSFRFVAKFGSTNPKGVGVLSNGDIVVAVRGGLQIFSSGGDSKSTIWHNDSHPFCVDLMDNILVAGNGIYVFTPNGIPLKTIGFGQFESIRGIVVDQEGRIIVCDASSKPVCVFN